MIITLPPNYQRFSVGGITLDAQIIEMATRMAQELQDFIADAEQAGSSLPGTQALVDEWEELYKEITA